MFVVLSVSWPLASGRAGSEDREQEQRLPHGPASLAERESALRAQRRARPPRRLVVRRRVDRRSAPRALRRSDPRSGAGSRREAAGRRRSGEPGSDGDRIRRRSVRPSRADQHVHRARHGRQADAPCGGPARSWCTGRAASRRSVVHCVGSMAAPDRRKSVQTAWVTRLTTSSSSAAPVLVDWRMMVRPATAT